MKLFDIQGDKVIIHNESLGIPCFRKVWENEKDKELATSYISYIVFKNKYDSPYVKAYMIEEREEVLKERFFGNKKFKLPKEVVLCENEYIRLMETTYITLLMNARNRLDSIAKFYKKALEDDVESMTDDRVKTIVAGIKELGNAAKSLDVLEDNARREESVMTSKIRGGAEINVFEMPKSKIRA
jgi:hypothetical protein